MKIRSWSTTAAETGAALGEVAGALAAASAVAPDFLVVQTSAHHDAEAMVARLGTAGAAVHGATSCLGVMTGEGPAVLDGAGLGIFAIWDPTGSYGSARAPFGDDVAGAARAATEAALTRAGRRGEAPGLVWVSSTPGCEEAVIAGIVDVVGANVPIVGGRRGRQRHFGAMVLLRR